VDIYHIWFDLKTGESDGLFCERLHAYLDGLKTKALIADWRLTRRKLGFAPDGFGDFHAMIETENLAQLENAFALVSARTGDTHDAHIAMNGMVENTRFALYRDFPAVS